MARDHARVKLLIWSDPDWRALSSAAQHLYFVLWTSPQLSYCGVADWRPKRIAALASDWTVDAVEAAGAELQAARFIVLDEDTEEVLIRSFVRHDGLMDNPNMAVSMQRAQESVASSPLRLAIVTELRRLRETHPNLKGWAKDQVMAMLDGEEPVTPSDGPSVTPSDGPSVTPFAGPSVTPSVTPSSTPSDLSAEGSVTPSDSPSPTPFSLAPHSSLPSPAPPSGDARKRAHRLPDDWKPGERDVEWQRGEGIPDLVGRRELPKFCDYWRGTGKARVDWSATWRNWLRKTMETEPPSAHDPHADDPGFRYG